MINIEIGRVKLEYSEYATGTILTLQNSPAGGNLNTQQKWLVSVRWYHHVHGRGIVINLARTKKGK